MFMKESNDNRGLVDLLNQLKSLVKKIDTEAFYPRDFLLQYGKFGYLQSQGLSQTEIVTREIRLLEKTANTCMTTAFNLWCQLAALTYLRNCNNSYLKENLLLPMESGEMLGGTGLSNPMKYYAGLEKLHLKAKPSNNGYFISGKLPSVSNLGSNHWFGIIAGLDEQHRIMAFVPCHSKELRLKQKADYLGLNGSATYSCDFDNVYVPKEWVISEDADTFVRDIRSTFVMYQIPLGLGVINASIQSIQKVKNKQGGCNQYLNVQCDELVAKLKELRVSMYRLLELHETYSCWKKVLKLRLDVANLSIKATHGSMLHHGAAGYLQNSEPSRRLREAYFLANLTPSIKHLEKLTY